MRLTARLNSQTGRPFGVMRSSGSRPTFPTRVILLTEATSLLVPSHFARACRVPVARGEMAPRTAAATVEPSLSDSAAKGIVKGKNGRHWIERLHNATRECERCGLPMTPVAEARGRVTLECANH